MDVDTLPAGTGDLPSSLLYHRRMLPARSTTSKPYAHSRNYIARSTAKRYSKTPGRQSCREIGLPCLPSDSQCPRCSADVPQASRRRAIEQHVLSNLPVVRLDRAPRSRVRWIKNDEEDCELARSAVPLPSDRFRLTRTPSLEREDAFRDASTAKGNVRLRRNLSDDAEVAELYRMGLLYDDEEQDRGEPFDLNSIEHQDPVYTVRPAKRSRRKAHRRYSELDQPLNLDLSFTDLGGDQNIAQFLSPAPSEMDLVDDEPVQQSSTSSTRMFAPLRVIYELDGSQPDIDVDTSQPPDLVSDLLSEYDYFSDSDLDDLPSLREEVQDGAATPGAEPWVVLGGDS